MAKQRGTTAPGTGDLLPCPFCGGQAKILELGDDGYGNSGGSCVSCTRCEASSPVHFDRKENLLDSWNRRTPDPALLAERDRLREALEQIAEEHDVGRHDGRPEPCPAHDAYTMWAIARAALGEQP